MKRFIYPFLSLLLLLSININLRAQQVYVDVNYEGSTESGSMEQPFKTIQSGVDAAQPGDVVYIRGGVYREQVGIGVDSIVIRNYSNEKAVVSGTEPVLEWEHVGGDLYKAIVPWDITANDQSNQVFVDGEMIHLTRWPKETSKLWVTKPTVALVDDAQDSGSDAVLITDNEFDEPKDRWLNAMVWVNLSNNHDGNGWTGKATFFSSSMKAIKVSPLTSSATGIHSSDGYDPWAVRSGSEYYLFNPAPMGVYSTGGPDAVLARGEWWKNADTLYVKMPDGESPASAAGQKNFVEVKKRLYAFMPAVDDDMNNVTIRGLNIFASTIITDKNFSRANVATDSYDNVIDSIHAKYIMHFIDQSGHYGLQWDGRCGIILSGVGNTLQNSVVKYSSGSGVSILGENHKVLGNRFYENNYQATEAGVVGTGGPSKAIDPEVGYNLIYNTPHIGIVVNKMYSSDPEQIGLIRIHHNVIMNFMLRSNDGGAINCSAGRNWDNIRIDHNIIANSNKFISIGIYTDYGGEALIDHNVLYNIDRPIQMNRYSEEQNPPIGESDGGPMGEIRVYNNTAIADSWSKPGIGNDHVNPSGEGMFFKNNIVSNRIAGELDLAEMASNVMINKTNALNYFSDYATNDFTLAAGTSSLIDQGVDVSPYNDEIFNGVPDIGAYEYGVTPWVAGPENVTTNLELSVELPTPIYPGDTLYFSATAYTGGMFEMSPQPEMNWFTDGSGTIDQNGRFIADSVTSNATVFVMVDSALVESKSFEISKNTTGISEFSKKENNNLRLNFDIFPNPAYGLTTIEIGETLSPNDKLRVSVVDLQGREVYAKSYSNLVNGKISIETESIDPGLYYVRIVSGSKVGSKSIIINR